MQLLRISKSYNDISTQNVMRNISRKQTSQMHCADWMLRKLCDWLSFESLD